MPSGYKRFESCGNPVQSILLRFWVNSSMALNSANIVILLTISLIKNVILDPLGGASIRVTDGNAQKEESRKSTYTTAPLTAQRITDHACMMISWIVVLVDT